MRKFAFHKLVRDKIVEQILSNGNTPIWKTLSPEEYIKELKKKVAEESQEIIHAKGDEVAKELADVQELIDSLLKELHISKEEFAKIQEKKNEKAGAFKNKHYIEYVETKNTSEWVEYYLKSPDKYPEIKE